MNPNQELTVSAAQVPVKHQNSILICQMTNGRLDLYVNSVRVSEGDKLITPIDKIANCTLRNSDVLKFMGSVALVISNNFGKQQT